MRIHNVGSMSASELQQARRELTASATLSRPDSPILAPISAHLLAIDAEMACRGVRMCSCGMATDDDAMMDGHLFEQPEHQERDLSRYLAGLWTPAALERRREGQPPSKAGAPPIANSLLGGCRMSAQVRRPSCRWGLFTHIARMARTGRATAGRIGSHSQNGRASLSGPAQRRAETVLDRVTGLVPFG